MKSNLGRRKFLQQSGVLPGLAMASPVLHSCKKMIGYDDPNELLPPDDTGSEHVYAYPEPPGLATSGDFVVWANGVPVWAEKLEVPKPVPPYKPGEDSFVARTHMYIGEVQRMAVARFSASTAANITIDLRTDTRVMPKAISFFEQAN